MMTISRLSDLLMSSLLIVRFLFCIAALILCILVIFMKPAGKEKIFLSLFLITEIYVSGMLGHAYMHLLDHCVMMRCSGFFYDLPVLPLIVTLIPEAAVLMISFLHYRRFRKTRISEKSIKDGIGYLSTGILFYRKDGRPVLINPVMNEIAFSVFGSTITDGNVFLQSIRELMNEGHVLKVPDGKAFYFHKSKVQTRNESYTQLTAVDVTEESRLHAELTYENERLEDMNRRYREFSARIPEVIREEEVLAAKIRIHDDIGHLLLASRMFLSGNTEIKADELLRMWRKNIVMFEDNKKEEEDESLKLLSESARRFGIQLEIDGEMPENVKLKRLICLAVSESMTNAVRHAGASELTVQISEDSQGTTVKIANDGTIPSELPKETGGLANLRRKITEAGGSMSISLGQRFILELKFEKFEGGGVRRRHTRTGPV